MNYSAYEILSDENQRRIYDETGSSESAAQGGGPQGAPQRSHFIHSIMLQLEWLYNGRMITLTIDGDCICSTCMGTGRAPGANAGMLPPVSIPKPRSFFPIPDKFLFSHTTTATTQSINQSYYLYFPHSTMISDASIHN